MSEAWLDTGDNAWQLTAATFVGLQSVPGLIIMYAGWVKHKWAINTALMCFWAFCMVMFCWSLYCYKAAFGAYMLPFVGTPGTALGISYQLSQSTLPSASLTQNYPHATMVYFQFVFAAITVVILAGGYLCRMNFYAWMVFVPLWLTLAYVPGAYSIWGGGFLYNLGVIDYSGGYVIHLSSGTAAFVGAWLIGPRCQEDLEDNNPNNLLSMLTGAGILWLGWNGFNGGDPYAASADAAVAVMNTNLCTAVSSLVWVGCDLIYYRRPSIIGAVQGMITGLVAITPAAGVVAGWGAIILGVGSGTIPWLSLNIAGRKLALFQAVDDVLDVFHTHFVGAVVGGFGVGLFATTEGCTAFGITNPGGAIDGNGRQVWVQIVGGLFIIGWDAFWTAAIMLFIKYVLRIPLRMDEETLLIGDYAIHGEEPYTFSHYNRRLLGPKVPRSADGGDGEDGLGRGVLHGEDPVPAIRQQEEMTDAKIEADRRMAMKEKRLSGSSLKHD